MRMTNGDVKAEISILTEAVMSNDRSVASSKEAFKFSIKFPLSLLVINIFSWVFVYGNSIFSVDKSDWDIGVYWDAFKIILSYGGDYSIPATVGLGMFFVLMFYSSALLYASIPLSARQQSKILCSVNHRLARIAYTLCGLVTVLSLVGVFSGYFILLFSAPAMIFLSTFIFNIYLGTETVKYGLGPVIEKISGHAKSR